MNWEKIKPGLWGAVGGAIVLAIIGFTLGGWVTGGTAQQTADDAAENAVLDRLAPICIEQFNQDSGKDQKLTAMKEGNSWERGNYVEKQGWATMPGEENPDSRVAERCGNMLMKIGQ